MYTKPHKPSWFKLFLTFWAGPVIHREAVKSPHSLYLKPQ